MTPLQKAAQELMDAMVQTDFTCRLGNQLDALEKALEAEQAQVANNRIEFLYEELRKATDGGSEFMTHDDALKQIAYWRNKCSQVQAVEPISPWQDRIQNKHPASDPEYWPDELIAKYARAEVDDLRREVGRLQSEAEQVAVPAPMTDVEIYAVARLHPRVATLVPHLEVANFARVIEKHHGIGVKP